MALEPENQFWTPNLSVKEFQVFNAGIEADAKPIHPHAPPAVLVSGPRKTGKTIGTLHRLVRHLWETPGARLAMFSKTMKSLNEGGVFIDLLDIVLPEWLNSGIGIEYRSEDSRGVPGPRIDHITRTIFLKLSNMHGGESELKLFSLDHDHEVKSKLKNKRFSAFYFSELSLFKDQNVFRVAMMALRMFHLKPWQHLFIGDTNPAEEGEESWIYKLWFLRRLEIAGAESTQLKDEFLKSLRLIEIFHEDNPWLSKADIEYMRALYGDDPGEFSREFEGKWVKGHGMLGKLLADVYNPTVHVIGGAEDEGDQIDVPTTTIELISGWDLGTGINHAAAIMDRRVMPAPAQFSVWCVLDEVVSLRDQMTIREFTMLFLERMRELETTYKRKFDWVYWSDDSSTKVFRGTGEGCDALEVESASKGLIVLQGVEKPQNSVRHRVRILRRLLKQKRFFVSSRCVHTRKMLEELKQGTTIKEYVAFTDHKHIFDAITYPMIIAEADELLEEMMRPTARTKETDIISVGGRL